MNFHATDPELGPALVSIKVILMMMIMKMMILILMIMFVMIMMILMILMILMIMFVMIMMILMILIISFEDVETEAGVMMTHVTLRLSIGTFQVIIMMIMVMKIDNQFSIIMKI